MKKMAQNRMKRKKDSKSMISEKDLIKKLHVYNYIAKKFEGIVQQDQKVLLGGGEPMMANKNQQKLWNTSYDGFNIKVESNESIR